MTEIHVSKTSKYKTINSAIEEAKENDVIVIEEGVYEEAIHLNKKISIIGKDNVLVSFRGLSVLTISEKVDATIRNITFQQQGLGSAVIIKRGSQQIDNCEFTGGDETVVITNGGTSPTFKNCKINQSQEIGLLLQNGCGGNFKNCTISNNKIGVKVFGLLTDPEMLDCFIHSNELEGITIEGSCLGEYKSCSIFKNGADGIVVLNNKNISRPKLIDCKIEQNALSGLKFINSSAFIEFLNICENKTCGIIADNNSEIIVSTTDIRKNGKNNSKGTGVFISNNSFVDIEKSQIQKNSHVNLSLSNNSKTTIRNTVISKSANGILANHNCKVKIYDSSIKDNSEINLHFEDNSHLNIENSDVENSKFNIYINSNSKTKVINSNLNSAIGTNITLINNLEVSEFINTSIKGNNICFYKSPDSKLSLTQCDFTDNKDIGINLNTDVTHL